MGICPLLQTILVTDTNGRKGTGEAAQIRNQAIRVIVVHELQRAVNSFQAALDILSAKVAQETGGSTIYLQEQPNE